MIASAGRAMALGVVALLLLSACGNGGTTTTATGPTTVPTVAAGRPAPTGVTPAPPVPAAGSYSHVVWVWMENHSSSQVLGSASAPYETALAHQFATAAAYADVGSPSLPNYIGATSGGTQGIADDASPSVHPLMVDNLFRQVRASGRSERSFEEAMPANCDLGSAGSYAVKHDPASYYTGADDRASCRADDVPLSGTALPEPLPAFSFVTPDLCHDTHDCSVATGDTWLKSFVPSLQATPEYRQGTLAVFIVWDEPTPMPFIAVSPTTPGGTVLRQRVDHYALLRTTEEMFGVPLLGEAASAPSMRRLLGL